MEYIQRLARERDNAKEEVHAISKALAASRADVARLVEPERDLETSMYCITEGIEHMTKRSIVFIT